MHDRTRAVSNDSSVNFAVLCAKGVNSNIGCDGTLPDLAIAGAHFAKKRHVGRVH